MSKIKNWNKEKTNANLWFKKDYSQSVEVVKYPTMSKPNLKGIGVAIHDKRIHKEDDLAITIYPNLKIAKEHAIKFMRNNTEINEITKSKFTKNVKINIKNNDDEEELMAKKEVMERYEKGLNKLHDAVYDLYMLYDEETDLAHKIQFAIDGDGDNIYAMSIDEWWHEIGSWIERLEDLDVKDV